MIAVVVVFPHGRVRQASYVYIEWSPSEHCFVSEMFSPWARTTKMHPAHRCAQAKADRHSEMVVIVDQTTPFQSSLFSMVKNYRRFEMSVARLGYGGFVGRGSDSDLLL